jgi:TP901 family phage tail tape measure protein|nr:MAG TPA: minor tail protein [Bacteriophage sp.]
MPGTYQYDVEIKSNVAKLLSDMKQVQDRLDTVEGREYTIKLNIDEKKLSNVISNLEKMLDSLGKGTGDFKQFENLSKELSSIVSEVQSLSKAFGKVDDSGAKTLLYSIQNIDKSLSELSQNILNVNKNMSNMGSNTSGAVKQVENITNESKKAASALEDVTKAQTKVNGQKTNISSASTESVTNSIKEENNVLEQNTQKVKENTQAKEQNANANLNKYDKRLDSYNGKVDKYQATINRFNDGGWTSSTYLENVQAVKNAVHEYETLLNELKGKDASLVTSEDINRLDNYEKKIKDTIATVTNMSASEKGYNFVSGQKELDKIHKLLAENSKMSSEAKAKIRAYYAEIESGNPSMSLDKIHGEILKIYNAEVEAGRAGRTLWDTLKNSGFHQIAAQMAGMFGVYDIINVVRQGINTVRELDTAMTEVRKVSNATETQYASFRDTISSTAKEIATTNKELLNSSADFLRLGYSLDQASDLAKNATLFVNVGDGVDITEATEDMITAMKAFDIQAEDSIKIVDDYNQIGNQFALSASDIGEAMKRSASALETGNNSFEQSIGLITAMNEIVQNSENTGNSLKVLSLRLRGAKAELEDMQEDTDGLCDSTSKLREQIKSLTGVDIMLDDNTFKSTTDIIKELGAVWDKLSDSSQAATLELIAGKSRANNVAALLKNYQRIDEVMESLGDAEGSAMRENEAIVDSIDGRIKKLSASMEDFWQKAINTDFVKNIVSSLDTILNLLTKIIDQFGLLPTIIGVGGAGTGIFKFIKNFDWVLKPYTKNSLQQFLVGQS